MAPPNSTNYARTTPSGGQLRDYDELEGTLLPTASALEPSAPLEQEVLPTARPVMNSGRQYPEEAPFIPPVPTDEHYRNGGEDVLARAQREGRMAAQTERVSVMRHNRKVHAYNNQAELDVDRANQAAWRENIREHMGGSAPVSAPPLEEPAKKKEEEEESYFSSNGKGGYEVKEYDMGTYDGDYSYDIGKYKSDYD